MEIGALYHAHGTPMGYLVDEEGRIASDLAIGADALFALARPEGTGAHSANGRPEQRGNRSLADSKIQRSGLPAGTPAPTFRLPTLDGGELALEDYQGRRVLLVFSDPKCGPCQALAPQLEQAHRRSGSVRILMVSRGDAEVNREKAKEHGLTLPIGLQKQWQISRAYAMFATPVAYLIDAEGVTETEVATGADAILALLSGATERPCGCGSRANGCGCKKCRSGATGGIQ